MERNTAMNLKEWRQTAGLQQFWLSHSSAHQTLRIHFGCKGLDDVLYNVHDSIHHMTTPPSQPGGKHPNPPSLMVSDLQAA